VSFICAKNKYNMKLMREKFNAHKDRSGLSTYAYAASPSFGLRLGQNSPLKSYDMNTNSQTGLTNSCDDLRCPDFLKY
jgi:hypothetical protein